VFVISIIVITVLVLVGVIPRVFDYSWYM
jgi:hypothetical protein